MARPRTQSFGDSLKAPHTVSLKVLRLTRPSLAQQFPLPSTAPEVAPLFRREASLAYPLPNPTTTDLILSPLLTLPESFQSAFVGEVFSCTLSVNNELPREDKVRAISGVRIAAEIITPSNQSGIQLDLETPATEEASPSEFVPGKSFQRIIKLNLEEEGDHTLAVTVTYTETMTGNDGKAAGGKVRTFRKLYQFAAAQLISVRTKACDVNSNSTKGKSVYVLEAQLENMGDYSLVLESVRMNAKAPFQSRSINWDMQNSQERFSPVLSPKDIYQVAFLLEGEPNVSTQTTVATSTKNPEKRFIVGQINVQWRSAMGDRGSISTGWLTAKKRS